mgnify:CR=1 FL=1
MSGGGGERMTELKVKKMLEQQLQLLSEQSQKDMSVGDLCALTREMAEIANLLLLYRTNQ